ncbi:MAG: glycosyltransferase family protein [Nannocystaceae bacterium]
MALVHYYVHGRGRGHASRSRAVIDRLRQSGHEVIAFAGADARVLLEGYVTTHAVDSVLPDLGLRAPRMVAARVRQAVAALRRDGAHVVVSDGDLPGLLAARLARRPSVAVGHGLVFRCCERPPRLPAAPWRREALKAAVSSAGASRLVAVNFVPLPVVRGRLARPAVPLPATRRTPEGPLLCYFRDGASAPLQRDLAALSRDMPVILFAKQPPVVAGIEHERPSRERFVEVLLRARAVVASAGSQLISECVALGTPLWAGHHPEDDEQALNVALLREAGLGDGGPLPQASEAVLRRFLERPAPAPSTWDAPDVATAVLHEVDDLVGGAR